MTEQETMEFDVVIVGAGPAGLAAAIRLAQANSALSICVLEKAAAVGDQILSGAVLDPRALNELIPDWQQKSPPGYTPVTHDQFLLLSKKKAWPLPVPPQMHNKGNYIISLGQFCRWLAEYAERLGVNIFPGFAATEIIYEHDQVCGVITGAKGIDKKGERTPRYQAGIALRARQTFFAEGCRGSLTQTLFDRYQLRKDVSPQTYGLGIKELWRIPKNQHRPGSVTHTIGWPLDQHTYGGSFIYHFAEDRVALGFVVGLDYANTYLNPYEEMQCFKTHPHIAALLANGERLGYGARTLNEGGFQSIPKLTFPGGLIIGCSAGFLDVPKIKGIHNAMKSGMVAAESVLPLLAQKSVAECQDYPKKLQQTWVWRELYQARNIRPAMRWGLLPGLAYAALDTYLFRGHAPWTLKNHADHLQLKKAKDCTPMVYPKHDQKLTFDLMSSVYLVNTQHDEDQPCHLHLKNPETAIQVNWVEYQSPEQRYCPAGVYEIIDAAQNPHLHIHAANCIQCKACDIKDPTQNIVWEPPEGGSGPRYEMM